jgi:hypothetical protein
MISNFDCHWRALTGDGKAAEKEEWKKEDEKDLADLQPTAMIRADKEEKHGIHLLFIEYYANPHSPTNNCCSLAARVSNNQQEMGLAAEA